MFSQNLNVFNLAYALSLPASDVKLASGSELQLTEVTLFDVRLEPWFDLRFMAPHYLSSGSIHTSSSVLTADNRIISLLCRFSNDPSNVRHSKRQVLEIRHHSHHTTPSSTLMYGSLFRFHSNDATIQMGSHFLWRP
jgi:hypothetical protein